jgi:hypothetical protein
MTEEPHASEGDPMTFDEIVDRAGRRVTTGLIVAGALIGLGIYWQPGPPRYQMIANGNQILRLDMRKGTIIGCEGGKCATVVRHGDHLSPHLSIDIPSKSPPAPAPAPAPAQPPAPAAR